VTDAVFALCSCICGSRINQTSWTQEYKFLMGSVVSIDNLIRSYRWILANFKMPRFSSGHSI